MTFANTLLRVEIPGLGSSLGQNHVPEASVDDANRLTPLWKPTSTARPFCSILGNSTVEARNNYVYRAINNNPPPHTHDKTPGRLFSEIFRKIRPRRKLAAAGDFFKGKHSVKIKTKIRFRPPQAENFWKQ